MFLFFAGFQAFFELRNRPASKKTVFLPVLYFPLYVTIHDWFRPGPARSRQLYAYRRTEIAQFQKPGSEFAFAAFPDGKRTRDPQYYRQKPGARQSESVIEFTFNKIAKAKNRINHELLGVYYRNLQAAAAHVNANASQNDLFRLALQMPEVMQTAENGEEADALTWEQVLPVLQEALKNLNQFRNDEGKALTAEIISYTERIRILLSEVEKFDPVRLENIKQRITLHMAELTVPSNSTTAALNRK